MMEIKDYWLILAGVAALFVLFFMSTFPLRFYFALLFFLILLSLQRQLFGKEKSKVISSHSLNAKVTERFCTMLLYMLGAIGSVIVVSAPSFDIKVYNDSVFATFSSLSLLPFAKVIFGLFLLSVFPGYVIYKNFLRRDFPSTFGKIGLVLALSYCVNALLGLILLYFGVPLSPVVITGCIWLLVFVSEVVGRISKGRLNQTSSTEYVSTRWESLLLLLTSLGVLLGSYGVLLTTGPISGVTGGDVADYMMMGHRFFDFGINSPTSWFPSYMLVGVYVTGLPMMYIYTAIQYLVLLIPISVYVFIKILFPQQRKAAAIGAFMVSLMQGLSTLPFLANLVGSPSSLSKFINGGTGGEAVLATVDRLFHKFGVADTGIYGLGTGGLEAGFFVFAMTFLYKFITMQDKRKHLTNLFFGALFVSAAAYTHHLFLFLCLAGTLMIFSLLYNTSKKRLFEVVGAIALFFFIFDPLSRLRVTDQFLDFYIKTKLLVTPHARAAVLVNVSVFIISLCIYLILLFRAEIWRILGLSNRGYKVAEHLSNIKRWFQTFNAHSTLGKFGFWTLGFFPLFLAFCICLLNFGSISIRLGRWLNPDTYVEPWFIWILYFGFIIPLVSGTLPQILKRVEKTSLKFILSWVLSILGLASFFYFLYGPGFFYGGTALFIRRYLYHLLYPLSCLAALAVTIIFRSKAKDNPLIKISIFKGLHRFSINVNKLGRYTLLTFLIFSMAFSFLSYVYVIGYYYYGGTCRPQTLSSSDAAALGWMYNNLLVNSTVVALSDNSYCKLCSIFPGKILPLYLEVGGFVGDIWPRNVLMKSQLPEVVLYSLNQLGAEYVFVSSEDEALLSNVHTGAFVPLIRTFPIIYSFNDVKIYKIPQYPLYEDSNYHVVLGMWDFPAWEYRFMYQTEYNATVISDDEQSEFWIPTGPPADLYPQYSLGITLSDDTAEKRNGTNCLKIEILEEGIYCSWALEHIYPSTQDWSGKDFVSFYWYGNNTGKTLAFLISGPDTVSFRSWLWIDDWNGWKKLVFPLDNPDFKRGSFDLSKVKALTLQANSIVDWVGQTGVFYLDRVIVDVGQWVKVPVMEQFNHLQASEMLLGGGIPYSTISDSELYALTPEHVYIFPCSPRVPQQLLDDLADYINDGTHVIFMDPSFASSTEIGQTFSSELDILNYNYSLHTPPLKISQIIFDSGIIDCSLLASQIVHFNNETPLDFVASFQLLNGSTIPFIVQEKAGSGSVTFVDVGPLRGMPASVRSEVWNLTRESIFESLPEAVKTEMPLSLPIPDGLFNPIQFRCSATDIWKNEDLRGYLLFYDDVKVYGNFTVSSNRMYLYCEELPVKEMRIVGSDNNLTIRDAVLYDIQVIGSGISSSRRSQAFVHNYTGGPFNEITVMNDSKNSEHDIDFTDAQIVFKISPEDKQEQIYFGDEINITASSCSYTLRTEQPTLTVNESMESVLQGAFIHGDVFFRAQPICHVYFEGGLSFKILYSSGITFGRVLETQNIQYYYLKNDEK